MQNSNHDPRIFYLFQLTYSVNREAMAMSRMICERQAAFAIVKFTVLWKQVDNLIFMQNGQTNRPMVYGAVSGH